MQTIPIDQQMMQVGERAGQEAHERFVREGIAHWHKEQARKERKDRAIEQPVETVKPAEQGASK